MSESELEKVNAKFIRLRADVWSLTIIENGVAHSALQAHVAIANRADRHGRARLYQLRGARRSLQPPRPSSLRRPRRPSHVVVSQRLKNSQSLLDLELRGVGNSVGPRTERDTLTQSALSFTPRSTVREAKRRKIRKAGSKCSRNLGLNIKIPDEYIVEENQRLRMYKKMQMRGRPGHVQPAELADPSRPYSVPVQNLLDYASVKRAMPQRAGVAGKFHSQARAD